tara:strand:- start:33462 stop:33653 length:192 start_codon:yes stop_codon:yes gene_type:complete
MNAYYTGNLQKFKHFLSLHAFVFMIAQAKVDAKLLFILIITICYDVHRKKRLCASMWVDVLLL